MNGLRSYFQNVGLLSRNIWMFVFAALLMGIGRQIFQVLRNQYLVDLGLPSEQMSSVQGFNSIGTLLIAVPAIAIIGRFRARTLLVAVALANSAGYFVQAWMGSLEIFQSAAFAAGLAMGLNVALAAPFLMRNTSLTGRVFAFSIQSAVSWPLSGFVGSWLSGLLQKGGATWASGGVTLFGEFIPAHLFGYRFALAVAAALVLLAIVPIALIKEAPPESRGRSIRELLRVHNKGRLFWLGMPELIIGFGAGLTVPFFNVYFKSEWSLAPEEIALVFMIMFVVLIFTYLLAPPLVKRFGAVKVIVASQLLSLPFFVELALGNHLVLAVIAFIMRQALMNLSDPIYRQFAQEVADDRDRNAVAVSVHFSRQLFFTVANFASGYLIAFDEGRFTIVIVTTIVLYVIAIGSELIILPRLDRVRRFQHLRSQRSAVVSDATGPVH